MQSYGIDTSIFVRLLTGDPNDLYLQAKAALIAIRKQSASIEILVSNIVIGEAYFVLQHHYGISKKDSCDALVKVLTSGLVAPQHGQAVLQAIQEVKEPGLMDRLIHIDYSAGKLQSLTIDKHMSRLPNCNKIV